MIRDSHVDLARVVFDADLLERLSGRTEPPDRNGCMLYRPAHSEARPGQTGQTGKAIRVDTVEGKAMQVSVLRVAFWFAGRGHVSHDHEVAHVCQNNGTGGKPLCVAPDHLERLAKYDKARLVRRAAAFRRLRRTFGGSEAAA